MHWQHVIFSHNNHNIYLFSCLFTIKISISESFLGRQFEIWTICWGKLIVWPLYLYWPPQACLTCRIGLIREMSTYSTLVSMESTVGWVLGSILFHLEKQRPLVSLWHRLQIGPLRDGWVEIPGYDSKQVVHVCMIDKASSHFRKDWVACVWPWCSGSPFVCPFPFCSTYLFLRLSFCWTLYSVHLSLLLLLIYVAWIVHYSHSVDGMFSRPIGMRCSNEVGNVVEAEILLDVVYVDIVWSIQERSWGWKLFGMNFVMLFEVTCKEKCEWFVSNFFLSQFVLHMIWTKRKLNIVIWFNRNWEWKKNFLY